MHLKTIFTSLLVLSAFVSFGQEIKTKVQESGFDVKPDPQKEEAFDEARLFVFLGGGMGIRTGEVLNGLQASDGTTNPKYHNSTFNDAGFRNGAVAQLGIRYFLEEKSLGFLPKNFGIGLRGGFFFNSNDFVEVGSFTPNQNSTATTQIFSLMGEFSYRVYITEAKKIFVYGGVGLGAAYIGQDQSYTYGRKYNVDDAFFAARPMLGMSFPVSDTFHVYGEAAYMYSQGKITEGTLSLSQVQFSAGIQIRLNAL